jgi:hypothetical protein
MLSQTSVGKRRTNRRGHIRHAEVGISAAAPERRRSEYLAKFTPAEIEK